MEKEFYEKTESTLRDIACGKTSGVEKLYELLSKRMFFVARNIVKDYHFADDIVQESFVKIVQNIDRYKAGTNGCSWVLTIVRNAALNFVKSDKMQNMLALEESAASTTFSEQSENILLVQSLLERLESEERRLVYMKYFLDMNVREIGQEIGKSKSYVAKKIADAEKKLKKLLKNRGQNGDESCFIL